MGPRSQPPRARAPHTENKNKGVLSSGHIDKHAPVAPYDAQMPACLRLSIDETIVTWRSCSALFFSMAAAAKVVVTTRVVADAKNIFTGSKLG